MKKGFYVVMVLCLLGTIAYAFDVDNVLSVFKKVYVSDQKRKEWEETFNVTLQKISQKEAEDILRNKISSKSKELTDINADIANISSDTVKSANLQKRKDDLEKEIRNLNDGGVNVVTKVQKKIRNFETIQAEIIRLVLDKSDEGKEEFKKVREEKKEYERLSKVYVAFQRGLAYAYRYHFDVTGLIEGFIKEFYE